MAEGKKCSHWGQNLQRRSFDSISGQVNKTSMRNLKDLISEKRGSRFDSGKLAKKETFDETSDDEIIVINKETIFEASIALTAGFLSDSLNKEEKDYGVVSEVGGIDQINYVLIRNHILRKWRDDVSKWISKEMFVGIVPKQCGALLDAAYGFLVSNGFINFGVAPSIKERILLESGGPSVIVVGAGLAGLAAVRQLMAFGFNVTVLEGRARAGGRVCTKKWAVGNNKIAAVDLGGSALTGVLVNPLGILVQQLSITYHKLRDECPLYGARGSLVDKCLDSRGDTSFNAVLDKLNEVKQSLGDVSQYLSLGAGLETFREALNEGEMNVFNWHVANLEFANANLLSMLSLGHWDQDDPFELEGDSVFLRGGNGKLVEALIENVPIHYGKIVESICYGGDGVLVTVGGGQVYKGDMVVCTVPLGVLKSHTIRFVPELPQRKLDAIKRLGFGLLNKVVLLFPHVFWGTDLDTFGHLSDHPSHCGEFFLFYNYATVAGGPVLIALVAGEAAYRFENEDPAESVKKVLQVLKGIFEPQGINVPSPLKVQCTRWGSDPFSRGSYSSIAVGASGDDLDVLAESVGGRLFFAGEATNRMYPATMHGAFLSGFREAGKIALSARTEGKATQTENTPATEREYILDEREYILDDLFRQPDVKLGCFDILYGRKEARWMAILRVTLSKRKEFDELCSAYPLFERLHSDLKQQQQSHFFRLVSRSLMADLVKVRGSDSDRMTFLIEKLGVTLTGKENRFKVHTMDSVIDSIKMVRMMPSDECSRKSKCHRLNGSD